MSDMKTDEAADIRMRLKAAEVDIAELQRRFDRLMLAYDALAQQLGELSARARKAY